MTKLPKYIIIFIESEVDKKISNLKEIFAKVEQATEDAKRIFLEGLLTCDKLPSDYAVLAVKAFKDGIFRIAFAIEDGEGY